MTNHILIVDDDPQVRRMLRRCLEGEGYMVGEASGRTELLAALAAGRVDLITLDLNLDGEDGLSLAREVRGTSQVPIIMITGKGDTIDRVVGLEMGADDYIAKPFHLREVLARVRSVLRRAPVPIATDPPDEPPAAVGQLRFEGWTLDLGRRELTDCKGVTCELTSGEFELLAVFAQRPNRVLNRDQIMDLVKGHDWNPNDRSIDNQIARLRKKIEADPKNPRLIKTVRGVGYTFTPART